MHNISLISYASNIKMRYHSKIIAGYKYKFTGTGSNCSYVIVFKNNFFCFLFNLNILNVIIIGSYVKIMHSFSLAYQRTGRRKGALEGNSATSRLHGQ